MNLLNLRFLLKTKLVITRGRKNLSGYFGNKQKFQNLGGKTRTAKKMILKERLKEKD